MSKVGHVLSSSPDKVSIGIGDLKTLEENKTDLQVGKFLKIEDGNHNYAVAIINNLTAHKSEKDDEIQWSFVIEASPIGALINNDDTLEFKRGTQVLPVPTGNYSHPPYRSHAPAWECS
ncbi:hypothetical protein, partial [Methylotuvimicrobium sp.]